MVEKRKSRIAQIVKTVLLLIAATGLFFRFYGYSGAGLLLQIGFFGLSLYYLVAAIVEFKKNTTLSIFYIGAAIVLLSSLLMLMRWFYPIVLLVAGMLTAVVSYVVLMVRGKNKQTSL